MIEIKPLKAEDVFWAIEHGVKECNIRVIPNQDIKDIAAEREASGLCITGWVDGEIVGCGGIDPIHKGVGSVWLLLTNYIDNHPKEGYMCIKEGFEKLIKDNKLRRIEGYGRVDFLESHILFKHLGFKVEGRKKEYTPDGVDVIMYGLVRK